MEPNVDEEYTEITYRGLPVLTWQFSEHSLEELNEEVYNMGIVDWREPLPKKLGGATVGLLMGITTTRTDSVLIHTLPNGLGIYRTAFIDQDGSQLAYGRPHQIFSKGGPKSYNQFIGELYQVRGELLDKAMSPDPTIPELDCTLALQIHMGLPGDNGVCFYPTPLEQETIPDQNVLDYYDPIEEYRQLTIMQSCYKATIPIARLRELVDEDDVADNLSYRCEKCSKCQDCKHSNKFVSSYECSGTMGAGCHRGECHTRHNAEEGHCAAPLHEGPSEVLSGEALL